jgi:hypothetical protein
LGQFELFLFKFHCHCHCIAFLGILPKQKVQPISLQKPRETTIPPSRQTRLDTGTLDDKQTGRIPSSLSVNTQRGTTAVRAAESGKELKLPLFSCDIIPTPRRSTA